MIWLAEIASLFLYSILVLAAYEICGLLIELSAGFVFGDPHVTTVSGRRYTFNGLGEYWLLQTQEGVNASLSVQCRTELTSAQGSNSSTRATVFTAFAFGGVSTMPVIEVSTAFATSSFTPYMYLNGVVVESHLYLYYTMNEIN